MHAILHLDPNLLDQFPLLAKWQATMKERKGLKAYFASGRQREMLNGSPSGQKPVV
jgi:hypothetical protein